MAFAAETRAAGVASSLRMILARTLIAVRVWLRASERIEVRFCFWHFTFRVFRFDIVARRRIGIDPWRDRARQSGTRWLENPSARESCLGRGINWMISALMKTPPIPRLQSGQPARAISDTRSSAFLWNEMCGMIAAGCDHFGREPYPCYRGRVRRGLGHAAHRHVRACRLMMINRGSDGGALTTLRRRAWEMRRRDVRPPSDSENFKKKARGGFLRPGFADSRDDVIYP